MSLEFILEHILEEANNKKEEIMKEAEEKADKMIQQAEQEAEKLYEELQSKERAILEAQKQRLIVNARLSRKSNVLKAKQELIEEVFKKSKSHLKSDKFKKQQILTDKVKEAPLDIDFYLEKIRQDNETEIAGILFS